MKLARCLVVPAVVLVLLLAVSGSVLAADPVQVFEDHSSSAVVMSDHKGRVIVALDRDGDQMVDHMWLYLGDRPLAASIPRTWVGPARIEFGGRKLEVHAGDTYLRLTVGGAEADLPQILVVEGQEFLPGRGLELVHRVSTPQESSLGLRLLGTLGDFETMDYPSLADGEPSDPFLSNPLNGDDDECKRNNDCDCSAGGRNSTDCSRGCLSGSCSVTCGAGSFACCQCRWGIFDTCRCRQLKIERHMPGFDPKLG